MTVYAARPFSREGVALFLDRDGTIIVDSGYLSEPSGVTLLPGVKEALEAARKHFRLFLFSNQSGIGRGYYGWSEADAVNRRMLKLLGLGHSLFEDICMAPEAPGTIASYRKPSPRFILESAAIHHLELSKCWMVGDRLSDLQAGVRAGTKVALVKTTEQSRAVAARDYCRKHKIPTFRSLADFIGEIIA